MRRTHLTYTRLGTVVVALRRSGLAASSCSGLHCVLQRDLNLLGGAR